MVSCVVVLGKVSVAWLTSAVEELVHKAMLSECFKSSRDGNKALID